eukprot:8435566-Alexandrium_andersonii.AAC.1
MRRASRAAVLECGCSTRPLSVRTLHPHVHDLFFFCALGGGAIWGPGRQSAASILGRAAASYSRRSTFH